MKNTNTMLQAAATAPVVEVLCDGLFVLFTFAPWRFCTSELIRLVLYVIGNYHLPAYYFGQWLFGDDMAAFVSAIFGAMIQTLLLAWLVITLWKKLVAKWRSA